MFILYSGTVFLIVFFRPIGQLFITEVSQVANMLLISNKISINKNKQLRVVINVLTDVKRQKRINKLQY